MLDTILDYTIGPVGRSVHMTTTLNTTRRGYPSDTFDYPFAVDTESMLIEIPAADMFKRNFSLILTPNGVMEESYERFDRGTLQFLRPEHAVYPAASPEKKTTDVYVKSGEYYRHNDMQQPENRVQITIMNGGDSSQYREHPYMHVKNTLQPFGHPLSNLCLTHDEGHNKLVMFTFVPDTQAPPPSEARLDPVPRCPSGGQALESHEWFDSVQVLIRQIREGSNVLTVNFRFIEQANDQGTHVVPLLFDVVNCYLNATTEMTGTNGQVVSVLPITVTLRKAEIPMLKENGYAFLLPLH